MGRPLPLNALRAFEAAARHGGFVAASEELHVSPGAISRHVRLLEQRLGVALFRRDAKGVSLTAAGAELLPALTSAFAQIARAAERVGADASELRLICPPGISIRWLLPRLDAFRNAHPDLVVRLTADVCPDCGLDASEADLGFCVARPRRRRRAVEMQALFPILLTPACAPRYLREKRLETPEMLSACELLHETRSHVDWTAWVKRFRPAGVDPARGQGFTDIDIATKAAVMGVGVVMADLILCREELEAGTLVAPFPEMVCPSPQGGICLIGASETWNAPKVAAFRTWADAAAEADRAYLSRLSVAR